MVEINDWQKGRFVRRVISSMFNTIRGKRIAVLGFAYKAHTTDTRDTAAIDICRGLLQDGAQLAVYDPKVRHDCTAPVQLLYKQRRVTCECSAPWPPVALPLECYSTDPPPLLRYTSSTPYHVTSHRKSPRPHL